MAALPNYVTEKNIPEAELIQTPCKGRCGGAVRYFKVSRMPWNKEERSPDLKATCLKCGFVTMDNYNW